VDDQQAEAEQLRKEEGQSRDNEDQGHKQIGQASHG